jgi:hypothetical protein
MNFHFVLAMFLPTAALPDERVAGMAVSSCHEATMTWTLTDLCGRSSVQICFTGARRGIFGYAEVAPTGPGFPL